MPRANRREEDLDWVAFRYLAGEMAERERHFFEDRLTRDVSACRAVASAVELTGAIARVLPSLPANSLRRRARPLMKLFASAAAASIALTFGLRLGVAPVDSGSPEDYTIPDSLTWSALRHEEPPPDFSGWFDDDPAPTMSEPSEDAGALASWVVELAGLDEESNEQLDQPREE